jgi:hypothetical protein
MTIKVFICEIICKRSMYGASVGEAIAKDFARWEGLVFESPRTP